MAYRLGTISSLLIAIFFIVPALCSKTAPRHCSTLSKMDNRIIDISVSIKHGAQVVAGVMATSGATCASKCCQMAQCHLAVFNKESVSNTGHNCYLVNCGSNLANCKLDYHHSFVSMSVAVGDSGANNDGRENYHIHSESSSPTTATTTATTAASSSTSAMTSSSPTGTREPTTVATASIEPDETPPENDQEDSDSTRTGGRHHGSETEDSEHDDTGSGSHTMHQHNITDDTSTEANAQGTTDPDKHTPHVKDGCSNVGCVGTGFIIVGVVGGVVAVVISLVLLIVAKRIINSRQRKKFQNVDYLINGMYS